ncbi:MAG TPA: sulfatase-like hydrolase/transferase [Hyphomicrobiaceae bacterium]|nr:sulfatase-like hydrolase/transferase [Hyphomicrobiaceae bacterium]
MNLGVLLLALAAILAAWLTIERGARRRLWTVVGLYGLTSALLIPVGDLERAFLLALILAAAITGISWTKHYHSGLKLTVADWSLMFAGTLRFLALQYRAAAALLALGLVVLISLCLAILSQAGGTQLSPLQRVSVLTGAICAFGLACLGGRDAYRYSIAEKLGFFSTFVMSLADLPAWRPRRGLTMRDVASEGLLLRPPSLTRSPVRPDIIVIQHESVFDPRLYGLALQPRIEAFFTRSDSPCGVLNVEIFGGGSWQSEFSFLSGLSSTSFGADAYFIQQRSLDRIHHTLPRTLAAAGYKTTLIASCRRSFLGYDAFYRSVGFDERIFADDLSPPFDLHAFERTSSDGVFLAAATRALVNGTACNVQPRFTYILTNYNHGPHSCTRAEGSPEARQFGWSTCADAQYSEYYARLSETVASWERMRAELVERLSGRPVIVVHYGDHQPVMTRRIERARGLPPDPGRHLRTFYAVDTLNFSCDREPIPQGTPLDLTYLGTATLQLAGLPLDAVSATRAALFGPRSPLCGEDVNHLRRRFHRTLLDQGLIDAA